MRTKVWANFITILILLTVSVIGTNYGRQILSLDDQDLVVSTEGNGVYGYEYGYEYGSNTGKDYELEDPIIKQTGGGGRYIGSTKEEEEKKQEEEEKKEEEKEEEKKEGEETSKEEKKEEKPDVPPKEEKDQKTPQDGEDQKPVDDQGFDLDDVPPEVMYIIIGLGGIGTLAGFGYFLYWLMFLR